MPNSPAPSQDIPELADYMDRYQLTEEEQHQAAQQIRALTSRVEEAEERAINAETENAELRDGLSHNLTRTDEELAESAAREERLRERIGAAYEILDNKYLPAEDRVGAALAALDHPPGTPSEAPSDHA